MGDYGIHCPCIHCESGIYPLDKSVYICSAIYRQLSMGNILGQSSGLQPHLMDTTTIINPYGFWLTTARFHHSSFTTWVSYSMLAEIIGTSIVNFSFHGQFLRLLAECEIGMGDWIWVVPFFITIQCPITRRNIIYTGSSGFKCFVASISLELARLLRLMVLHNFI